MGKLLKTFLTIHLFLLFFSHDAVAEGKMRFNSSEHNEKPIFAIDLGIKNFVTDVTMHKIHKTNFNMLYMTGHNGSDDYAPFLTKYNTEGKQIWYSTFFPKPKIWDPIIANEVGITTDINSNIFITGRKCSEYKDFYLSHEENCNYFLVKFKPKGEQVWAFENKDHDYEYFGERVVTDFHGNVFVIGIMKPKTDKTWPINAPGFMFMANFDPSGELKWFKKYDPLTGKETQLKIYDAVSDGANIYVAGSVEDDFDGQKNKGRSDVFVIKFDNSGEKQWSHLIGTEKDDAATGLALNGLGVEDTTVQPKEEEDKFPQGGIPIVTITLPGDSKKGTIPTVTKTEGWDERSPGTISINNDPEKSGEDKNSSSDTAELYEECKKGCALYVVGLSHGLSLKEYDTFFIMYNDSTGGEGFNRSFHIKHSFSRTPDIAIQGDFVLVKDLAQCMSDQTDEYDLCVTAHEPLTGDIKWAITSFKEDLTIGDTMMVADTNDGVYIINEGNLAGTIPYKLYKFGKANWNYSPIIKGEK